MKRRVADDDAADADRLQPRNRGQLTGAADLNVDALKRRLRLFRREFVREAPARRAGDEAQPLLPVEPIDLIDDAVDVVGKVGALRFDPTVVSERRFDLLALDQQVADRQAERGDGLHHAELRVGGEGGDFAPAMRQKPQRPRGGDAGVLLPERSGSSVARIGENLSAVRRLTRVEVGEIGL